jgi:transcriptional regulator with PAS, ATPase and Fis domain
MRKQGGTDGTSAKVLDDLDDGNITLIPNKKTDETIDVSQNLSLFDQEKNLIVRALEKHKGKRKYAAEELGISERTLYRKIKEFDL